MSNKNLQKHLPRGLDEHNFQDGRERSCLSSEFIPTASILVLSLLQSTFLEFLCYADVLYSEWGLLREPK